MYSCLFAWEHADGMSKTSTDDLQMIYTYHSHVPMQIAFFGSLLFFRS